MLFVDFLGGWASNIFAPVFCFALVIYAVLAFNRYKRDLIAFEATLDSVAKTLSVAKDRASFREHFDEIHDYLIATDNDIGSGAVGAAWAEFEPTIISNPDTGLSATRRPSDFFDARLYIRANIDLRAFESIPNQLVGIGLGLTFAGIVWSLVNAAPDISGGSVQAAQRALSTLLETASFKFSTSLFAIVSSIIFTWRKNTLLHRIDLKIEALCATIERCIDVQTADGLAARSLIQLEQQTTLLEFFKTDLAVSIGDAVNKAMNQEDTGAMTTVRKALEDMAERLQGLNQDALGKMVGAFTKELSGAAKTHVDQLAQMLALTADGLAKVPIAIDAAGERFDAAVDKGADNLSTKMTTAGESIDATFTQSGANLVRALEAPVAAFERVPIAMDAAGERFEAVIDKGAIYLSASMVTAGEAIDATFTQSGANLVRALEAPVAAFERVPIAMDAAGERFEAVIDKGAIHLSASIVTAGEAIDAAFTQSSANMVKAMEAPIEALGGVSASINAAGDRFKEAVSAGSDELVTAMAAAGESLDAMFQDSAKLLVAGMDAAVARLDDGSRALGVLATEGMAAADRVHAVMEAAASATAGIAGLADQLVAAGEASGALAELAISMREAGTKLVSGVASISELTYRTAEIAANTERTSGLLATRMELLNKESTGLNTALAGAFQKVGDGLGSFGEKTTKVVRDIDVNLASSVKALSGAIERFDELIEALPKRDDYAKLTSAITAAGHKAASQSSAPNGAAE